MTCRLLCALLVLALCCCPFSCVAESGGEDENVKQDSNPMDPEPDGQDQARVPDFLVDPSVQRNLSEAPGAAQSVQLPAEGQVTGLSPSPGISGGEQGRGAAGDPAGFAGGNGVQLGSAPIQNPVPGKTGAEAPAPSEQDEGREEPTSLEESLPKKEVETEEEEEEDEIDDETERENTRQLQEKGQGQQLTQPQHQSVQSGNAHQHEVQGRARQQEHSPAQEQQIKQHQEKQSQLLTQDGDQESNAKGHERKVQEQQQRQPQQPENSLNKDEEFRNKKNLTDTKETANKHDGDSDSNTAASHTTSPLLLFVACAAAAAVVAA
ncbi:Mucin-associated surface protein (MASP) [Trypanosoma cruzi]|nr:Mucin-associated surface protein (MASP) [Trypanosoma cruzi]